MREQRNKIEQARREKWFVGIKQAIKDFALTLHDVARQKRGFQQQKEKDETTTDKWKR